MGITPPLSCARTADSSQTAIAWQAAAIGCLALAVFAFGLSADSFVDEYAYITQSFYADLLFQGRLSDPLWLELYAYDLQPLPKYLIGFALQSAHLAMPTPGNAAEWYRNYASFGSPATLWVARIPFVVLGALGCAALCACGALVKDRRTGTIAAALLVLNPLYRLLSHRAMSDVPCEAFLLVTVGLGLWLGRRIWCDRYGMTSVALTALAGISAGLSLLCKFNGFLGLLVIGTWCALAWVAPGLAVGRKVVFTVNTLAIFAVALFVCVALNPFLTARPTGFLANPEPRVLANESPLERFVFQVEHRVRTSNFQRDHMSHNALYSLPERALVLFVQGFGRFGPFGPSKSDSTIRSDSRQDWGMILWVPLVLFGLVDAVRRGRVQLQAGQPPVAVALLVWAALSWIVVAFYLPMAWDRYLLPIQSGNAMLAALAASAIWDRLAPRVSSHGARV